jgi:histidinol-phosphatase (PHP family)
MMPMSGAALVSVHGGHSGQFCSHARDRLEEVVTAYIAQGFLWVGITEHSPPDNPAFLYPEERQAGLTPTALRNRFAGYMAECRRLQSLYREKITLYAAMEIETCSGYQDLVPELLEAFQPDYIVGSVHFVDDRPIDYSAEEYLRAAAVVGSLEELYCRYFDQQYEMISRLKPSVVGHFDLIRIFDPGYRQRLSHPEIARRIWRNLQLIRDLDLIMDLNLRALDKGAEEPYISRPILEWARELDIAVVPGDDSHGVASVGRHLARGTALLTELGFDLHWRRPRLLQPSIAPCRSPR